MSSGGSGRRVILSVRVVWQLAVINMVGGILIGFAFALYLGIVWGVL